MQPARDPVAYGLEHEQTPEAEDDARHGGHQVDDRPEDRRAAAGRVLGDEERGEQSEWNREHSAMTATWMVPTSTAAMPMTSWLGSQRNSVKNDHP